MKYYKKKYNFIKKNFINASNISDFSISIPVGPHINKVELKKIIKKYYYILNKFNK